MNPLQSLVPGHVAEALGSTLMHAIWQLAVLALALMLALAIVPRKASALRYWLGVGTLGLMLIAPFATFGILHEAPGTLTHTASAGATSTTVQAFPLPFAQPATITRHDIGLMERVQAFFEENAYLFLALWTAGALFFGLRFLLGYMNVRRLRSTGLSDPDADLAARFQALQQRLGLRGLARLKFSSLIDTPMVVGALRPIVLLPAGLLSGLSTEQIECILIHELAHVRRFDYLVNIFQSLAEVLLFFHPATWWVTRLVREERENCCDELVIAQNSNKVQYARALLNLEVARQQRPALAMASNGGALSRRIRRITGAKPDAEPRYYTRGLLFGFITVLGVLVLATQTPQVVQAAIPFFAPEEVAPAEPESPREPQTPADPADTKDLARMAQYLQTIPVAIFTGVPSACGIDSPITKIVMNENGAEVVLEFDKTGTVVAAQRNGQTVPTEDLGRYQGMADNFLRRAPGPPAPGMPAMPPMPPMPDMADMPPMPPMPDVPAPGSADFDSRKFERAMEDFGRAMEGWGRNLERNLESQDWQKFEQEMERWGQGLAHHILGGEDDPQMAELHTEMRRLEDELNRTEDGDRADALSEQLDDLSQRLSELQAAAIERKTDEFGRKMEDWGERYAARMEQWAEEHEQHMKERQREDAEDERAAAEEAEEIAEADAELMDDAVAVIGRKLQHDGLIRRAGNFKLRITKKEMWLDGKKQPEDIHRKYKGLVEELMELKLGNEGITIHQNSN